MQGAPEAKKQAGVSPNSKSVTTSLEVLQRVSCIWYSVPFQAQQIETLIDSGNEVNSITPGFAAKLGLIPRPTNVGAQKIDDSTLETYGMA